MIKTKQHLSQLRANSMTGMKNTTYNITHEKHWTAAS
jgi:hypothetical protein